MNYYLNKIKFYFESGHKRSIEAKKNIFLSFIVKIISILVNLAIVPLTINYVNTTQYGIWLTLSSIVSWFTFFDIGFGNGLRNRFAESKAKGNTIEIKKYISTTYFSISFIFISIWVIFIFCNQFIDWTKILNAPLQMGHELSKLALIVVSFFCLQVILKIFSTILIADQKPALSALYDTIGQVLSVIIIFLLTKFTNGSLILLGSAVGFSPLLIYFLVSYISFRGKYKHYSPSFNFVNINYAKDILNLGYKFFIIQIAAIIQYQTANIIIAQNFSPIDVTAFNIVYKYFGIINMFFSILLTPFWSASTDAYTLGDYSWIENSVKKYLKIFVIVTILGIVMLLLSNKAYSLWIGNKLPNISFSLSLWTFIYFTTLNFGSIFVSFLNGIGKIKIQFFTSLITPIFFIVLSYILVSIYKLPIYYVLISSVVANIYGIILAPFQYYLIIKSKAKGLWNK